MKINNNDIKISDDVIKDLTLIETFNETWPRFKEKVKAELSGLKSQAQLKSVGAAARISGVVMTDYEIELFLKKSKKKYMFTQDQLLILGYRSCLRSSGVFFKEKQKITEQKIKSLHKQLFSFDILYSLKAGDYRKVPVLDDKFNNIHATKASGVYQDIRKNIEKLIFWFNSTTDIHVILKVAIFIVHFLSIYPFDKENEKLSYILTHYLLLQVGYEFVHYCSFESIIEQHKLTYFRALSKTQKSFNQKNKQYEPWLNCFFNIFKTSIKILENKEHEFKFHLSKNQQLILDYSEKVLHFTKQDIQEVLGLSNSIVNTSLKKLIDVGVLKREFIEDMILYKKRNYFR